MGNLKMQNNKAPQKMENLNETEMRISIGDYEKLCKLLEKNNVSFDAQSAFKSVKSNQTPRNSATLMTSPSTNFQNTKLSLTPTPFNSVQSKQMESDNIAIMEQPPSISPSSSKNNVFGESDIVSVGTLNEEFIRIASLDMSENYEFGMGGSSRSINQIRSPGSVSNSAPGRISRTVYGSPQTQTQEMDSQLNITTMKKRSSTKDLTEIVEKGFKEFVPTGTDEKRKWKVGSTVEVWSNSQKKWIKSNIYAVAKNGKSIDVMYSTTYGKGKGYKTVQVYDASQCRVAQNISIADRKEEAKLFSLHKMALSANKDVVSWLKFIGSPFYYSIEFTILYKMVSPLVNFIVPFDAEKHSIDDIVNKCLIIKANLYTGIRIVIKNCNTAFINTLSHKLVETRAIKSLQLFYKHGSATRDEMSVQEIRLTTLLDCRSLQKLQLDSIPFVGPLFANFCSKLYKHPLKELTLSRCDIGVQKSPYLARLIKYNQNLEKLNVGYNAIDDIALKNICKGLCHNKTLRQISFRRNQIRSTKSIGLALEINKTLEIINLAENLISDTFTLNDKLKELILFSNKLTSTGLRDLTVTLPDSKLIGLDISNNRIVDGNPEDYDCFCMNLQKCKIKKLYMKNCGCNIMELSLLLGYINMNEIRMINIAQNNTPSPNDRNLNDTEKKQYQYFVKAVQKIKKEAPIHVIF